MLVVFLPALNFRGNRSPYLWWFYKLVTEYGGDAAYVCGDEYFLDPSRHLADGREDASESLARRCKFKIPDEAILAKLIRSDIPTHVWQSLEALHSTNPLAVFKHYCTEKNNNLYEAITVAVDQIQAKYGTAEAVVTCVNCATLSTFCQKIGMPLIHLELGPLRAPHFLPTAYFDFNGVNGNTEARGRFEVANQGADLDECCTLESLRSLFVASKLPNTQNPVVDLGLALQVEDDSNIICFSNGFTSLALINSAKIRLNSKEKSPPVLVRSHPGSLFSMRNTAPELTADESGDSVEFILKCKLIHTINSSVAVEALLLGRDIVLFGESSVAFCVDAHKNKADELAFCFYLLNYLVPWDIAFSIKYIRWRLSKPTESMIKKVHLEGFMQEKIKYLESRVSELEQALEAQNKLLIQIKSSFTWRLAYPLRAMCAVVRRIARQKKITSAE